MTDRAVYKTGGVCSILLGISYVISGMAYLALPAAQKGGTLLHDTGSFLSSLAQAPALTVIHHLALGLGALLGIGVVLAVVELTKTAESGWTPWLNAMAGLSFAVTAVDNFGIAVIEPLRAAGYTAGDAAAKSALAVTQCMVSVDPVMGLGFGLAGLWVFFTSLLAFRRLGFPVAFGLVGMATGLIYFLIEVGTLFRNELLITLTAGLGALILGPVWYVWLGLSLRKRGCAELTPPATICRG